MRLEELCEMQKRDALCLIAKPFAQGARCYSGGAPTLPEGMVWPVDSRGMP
jgi:hypothetical protein